MDSLVPLTTFVSTSTHGCVCVCIAELSVNSRPRHLSSHLASFPYAHLATHIGDFAHHLHLEPASSMRPLVAYDDLPHESDAVEQVAPSKRRRRTHESRYTGPHWDAPEDPADATTSPAAVPTPWSDEADQAQDSLEPRGWDLYDSDDAMIASPHEESHIIPFFTDTDQLPESSHTLTADDIWDDKFLVDVWNAAEQEYCDFHARRSEAIEHSDSKWHGLPHVGTPIALPLPPPPPPPLTTSHTGTPEPTRGWTLAQKIVAQTPNCVGGRHSKHAQAHDPHAFQNAVMAWYYAGYYTALYQAEPTQSASQPASQPSNTTNTASSRAPSPLTDVASNT